jgi:hypothetical protein
MMNGSCCCKLNWKLNIFYDKWLGFTNSYIFDDRFNWCPFWFNVVVIMTTFFSCQYSNFKILKHYPYNSFFIICCWCFKNAINSIHKTIRCCIVSSTEFNQNIFLNVNCKMQPAFLLKSFESLEDGRHDWWLMSIALKIIVGPNVLMNTFSLFFAQVYLYQINTE